MKLTPISWKEFVKRLKKFGWKGPYKGGKHFFMVKGSRRLIIPNPHKSEIGKDLLRRILKQAKIPLKEWIKE